MGAFVRQLFGFGESRRARWIASLAVAVAIALSWRALDERGGRAKTEGYGADLARQVAGQAEGLALEAGIRGAEDPLGRALSSLEQGPEPRPIRVAREPGAPAGEEIRSNERGEVSLQKSLNIPGRDGPEGLRVTVGVPQPGFLGAQSPVARDALLLLVIATITALLGFVFELRAAAIARSRLSARQQRLRGLLPELREILLGIGRRLRDIFRHFEALGGASAEAASQVAEARAGFHQSIRLSRGIGRQADEVAGCALHAEAALLNLMLEAGRIARSTGSSPYPVHLIHQQLIEVRQRSERLQREVRDLERALEPLTTDLDLACNALSDLRSSLEGVPAEIDGTSTGLADQAEIFRKIRDELAG